VIDRAGPEATVLRPAIEWAVIVARQDQSGDVVTPAPPGMRPYLRFRRLPARAARAIQSAIEPDDEFRARVAEAAGPEEVGRGAWLWLTRPEGWEDEYESLVDAEAERVEADSEGDAERSAVRRLERAEAAAARWEAQATELEVQLERTRHELAGATARLDELATVLEVAANDVARLTEERARAVRELKELEARLQRRDAEVRALREVETTPVVDREPSVDRADVARLAARALAGLDAIDAALSELSELVEPGPGEDDAPAPVAVSRRPLRIGQGLTEDSAEAARWLLGLDDVVVLVDAYNLSMATWPDLSSSEQRRILERTLVGLGGRTGARFIVVYDGDDVIADTGPRPPGLDVRFTAADVEADDEILRLVDLVPTDRVVVVVSDDRRVRDGATARGANVVGSRQLRPLLLA
jgi:hypothetical protein